MKRRNIKWILFKGDPVGWTASWAAQWFRRFLCKTLGHKKPYDKRFSCESCPRCFLVLKEDPKQLTFNLGGRDGS